MQMKERKHHKVKNTCTLIASYFHYYDYLEKITIRLIPII